MTKIIRLDDAKKGAGSPVKVAGKCLHREATVYTRSRTVCCSFCGTELDPFDVLVDLVQISFVPDNGKEQRKYVKEVKRRKKDT